MATPLFELFLDLPHPRASVSCPPPFVIPSPVVASNQAQELTGNIEQIARFAYPEYDESTLPPTQPAPINAQDVYAMQLPGFQHFTFTMQLQTGERLYGHVRRYLPPHLDAKARYDVGRRGERALVLLTKASGADPLFAAILKSMDAIMSQQAVMQADMVPSNQPQQAFLHLLVQHHQFLIQAYEARHQERGKPLIANLPGIEIEHKMYHTVDTSRFIFPTSLLYRPAIGDVSSQNSSSILPLLRCVGVAHALRIMAALLSERRIVMVSSSPTRLANCSHAALGMLAQGLLQWQHLYIPVLPPHLWPYLAAPYPYLIGILAPALPKLDRTDGLGEVLIIHLDTNQMETRNIETHKILQRLPDLFVANEGNAPASASEMLAQDLLELLKSDKKQLYGESTLGNVSETAAKATKAAAKATKAAFNIIRNKGKQYLSGGKSKEQLEDSVSPETVSIEEKSLAADYIYTEGCHNESAEEEARIAFTSFFLCMYGNMRWYLSGGQQAGDEPKLDRNKFLQTKHANGDGEGTPMWPLLRNFCQTQMLEEFAKARIEEVRARLPVTPDSSLFVRCATYHRQNQMPMDALTVRRTTRQVAQSSPARVTGMILTNARRMAMTLTSNKNFEGDYGRAIAELVEQCRESTSVLFDVMSVIWLRIRDSRGMQWKHGYHALQILKNLLYHGPLAVIAEATDGLDKIRAMKYYEHMRSSVVTDVRSAAGLVYNLLVDRSRLFHVRRACAERRRALKNPTQPRLFKDTRLRIIANFKAQHAAMSPSAQGTIARIPPLAPSQSSMQRGNEDLLGMSSVPPPVAPPGAPPAQIASTQAAVPGDDLTGLFSNMNVGQDPSQGMNWASPSVASSGPPSGNPFEVLGGSGSVSSQTSTSSAPNRSRANTGEGIPVQPAMGHPGMPPPQFSQGPPQQQHQSHSNAQQPAFAAQQQQRQIPAPQYMQAAPPLQQPMMPLPGNFVSPPPPQQCIPMHPTIAQLPPPMNPQQPTYPGQVPPRPRDPAQQFDPFA